MGVRVRIKLRYKSREVITSALVNTGYEGITPEIHLPLALARRLGYSFENVRIERYVVVGGEVNVLRLGQVYITLDVEGFNRDVLANVICTPGEYEVIVNDVLAEELGIEIVAPRRGLWRIKGEGGVRESAEPMFWLE
ncbi:MAG: hypothetical protein LM560_06795 [Desulfurococcaceae archaeon]|jgi:hypothetical protein|nr:hypothetical protein [Desulfurococcaceae archaeon]